MIKPILKGVVTSVLVAIVTPSMADVTLGTAGDPKAGLDSRLNSLWAPEHRALETLGVKGDLSRLVDKEAEDPLYSRERINKMAKARGNAQWQCLTEALYFEARGETLKDQDIEALSQKIIAAVAKATGGVLRG